MSSRDPRHPEHHAQVARSKRSWNGRGTGGDLKDPKRASFPLLSALRRTGWNLVILIFFKSNLSRRISINFSFWLAFISKHDWHAFPQRRLTDLSQIPLIFVSIISTITDKATLESTLLEAIQRDGWRDDKMLGLQAHV
jgi:hypothetical protein